jgi:hypothetical protein
MPGAAAVIRDPVLAYAGDHPSEVEDREYRERGADLQRVLSNDFDDIIGQLGHVAGAGIVPPAVRE